MRVVEEQQGRTSPSLLARIAAHARTRPDAPALAFLARDAPDLALSWAGLQDRIQALGRWLVGAGVRPGDVVFVLSPAPAEQALAFLAAMAAGALPSILSFPSRKQSEARFLDTLVPIARATGARWVVAAPALARAVTRAGLPLGCLVLPAPGDAPGPVDLPAPADDFLQFSSGTTGLRKCVRITGAMLAHQLARYGAALALDPADRVASWLPLYHDMGLVACLLLPLFHGISSVHLSPFDWVAEPLLLFQAMARHRATLAWLPNFAYELCAARIPDQALADLDLSSLRALINCSEPVRPRAHERLLARLAGQGIREHHLQACYAMAEATFAVTQTEPGRPARIDRVQPGPFAAAHRALPAGPDLADSEVLAFVSCGRAIAGVEVAVDVAFGGEQGHGADGSHGDGSRERRVGEILIRGESVIPGYGVDGRQRGPAFDEDGWYRTGDLGYLADGELFVTGRAKDLIIHRGGNVYPGDVEEVVAGVPGVKPGRVVVFGVYDEAAGTEDIAVMLEPDGPVEPAALRRQAREAIWARLDMAVAEVAVCEPGTLRKSTSGKLSRSANRALYLERRQQAATARQARPATPHGRATPPDRSPDTLQGTQRGTPRDLWERQLVWIWEDVLGVAPIGIDDNLFLDLKADSMAATRAAAEVQHRLGHAMEPSVLLGADTIARQAALLRDAGHADRGASPLITLRRGGPGRDLFLVHPAGGWAFPYVTLARHLGPDRPIHAFQPLQLHLHGGELAHMSVERLADDYIAALKAVQPRGPYLLGGWSFGGVVAFEMAGRLLAAGDAVQRVIMFDTEPPRSPVERGKRRALAPLIRGVFRLGLRAPSLRRRIPELAALERLSPVWRFFIAYHLTGDEVIRAPAMRFAFADALDAQRLVGTDADAAWDYALELARASQAPADRALLVPGLDGAGARRSLAVIRKLDEINQRYRPAGPYAVDVDMMAVRGNRLLRGWRRYVGGRLSIYPFDIETCRVDPHWDMMEEDNVVRYAPLLRRMLAALDSR